MNVHSVCRRYLADTRHMRHKTHGLIYPLADTRHMQHNAQGIIHHVAEKPAICSIRHRAYCHTMLKPALCGIRLAVWGQKWVTKHASHMLNRIEGLRNYIWTTKPYYLSQMLRFITDKEEIIWSTWN